MSLSFVFEKLPFWPPKWPPRQNGRCFSQNGRWFAIKFRWIYASIYRRQSKLFIQINEFRLKIFQNSNFRSFWRISNSSKIRFDLQDFVIRTSYSWTLRIFWVLLFFAVKLLPYDSHRSFISVVIDNNGTWVMRIPLRVTSAR